MSSRPTTRLAFFPRLPPQFLVYVIVPWPSPPSPPTLRPPSSFHMAAEPKSWPTLPTWKLVRRRIRKRQKPRRISLTSVVLSSLFLPFSRRKGCHCRLHNSWETHRRKPSIEWFKKSLVGEVVGGRVICMPVFVPLGRIFDFLPIHHCAKHSVIVCRLSLTSATTRPPLLLSRHVSMGKKSFHHVLAKREIDVFSLQFFADTGSLMDSAEPKV